MLHPRDANQLWVIAGCYSRVAHLSMGSISRDELALFASGIGAHTVSNHLSRLVGAAIQMMPLFHGID